MSKVKICGLRREEDIDVVNGCVPDYIGFVFAQSKRQVDPATAARLKNRLSPEIGAVGVFVNQGIDLIATLCQSGVIDLVQLHGEEDEAYIKALRERVTAPIIRSVPVGGALPGLPRQADYLLFDKASPQRGGTGESFRWETLAGYGGKPYFLAGGLHPGNVEGAVQLLRPFCVDVSSGVETDGGKDAGKIREFVEKVRGIH